MTLIQMTPVISPKAWRGADLTRETSWIVTLTRDEIADLDRALATAHDSGKPVAEHGGNYYPDAPMSINFNLWFINDGLNGSSEARSYQEDIDWVYHEAGAVLTPDEVNKKVNALRQAGTGFVDTILPGSPALESPCDL